MFNFIYENLATIIISVFLALGVGAIVLHMVRNKRRGKTSCSSCSGCSGCTSNASGKCHK